MRSGDPKPAVMGLNTPPPGTPPIATRKRLWGPLTKFWFGRMFGVCAMTNRLFLDLDLDRQNPFERHTVKDVLTMILIVAPVTADAKCRS